MVENSQQTGLKKALFLHIQKTAGTSIVKLAARYYGNHNVASHADYVGKAPQQFRNTPFVSGHFGYDYARKLMLSRYSFTFLRDPAERILSYYYFCRGRKSSEYLQYELARQLTLNQFLEQGLPGGMLRSAMWNNQCWQLAHGYDGDPAIGIDTLSPDELLRLAISHLQEFSYVGFTSTFAEDKDRITQALGISGTVPNVRANTTEGATYTGLPRSTRQLLEQLIELDRELFRYAWSQRKPKSKWFADFKGYFKRR